MQVEEATNPDDFLRNKAVIAVVNTACLTLCDFNTSREIYLHTNVNNNIYMHKYGNENTVQRHTQAHSWQYSNYGIQVYIICM